MAAKQQQQAADGGLSAHLAGLSRSQLLDVMSQMKALIDENQEQARRILVDNPALTRALFQAQIMLGMVKPPKSVPVVPQAISQIQSLEVLQPSAGQTTQSSLVKPTLQDRAGLPRPPLPAKHQNAQPSIPFPAPSNPTSSLDPPTMPTNPLQPAQAKGFPIHQMPSVSIPQSSQHPNVTLPPPVPPQYSAVPSHMPIVHSQPQQPLQNPGMFNQQLQPPLPQLPRPPSMQSFPHQMHPQIPNSFGLSSNAPQHMLQQPMFHQGGNPQASFLPGQPPLPNQPPPQQLYQAGSHVGAPYNSQTAAPMQVDRLTPWARGHPEASSAGSHFPGHLPVVPGQMAQGMGGIQTNRSEPPLTPEMEKMLVQQVLSMSQEQINMLPPEQRQQVLQLREMLRQ